MNKAVTLKLNTIGGSRRTGNSPRATPQGIPRVPPPYGYNICQSSFKPVTFTLRHWYSVNFCPNTKSDCRVINYKISTLGGRV